MSATELIFKKSRNGRAARSQFLANEKITTSIIPGDLLRKTKLGLPSMSELDVVRHFTTLSKKNFSIDTHFYPLGSCTMKYNPRGVAKAVNFHNY